MEVKSIISLSEIDAKRWNGLAGRDYPFTRHEFLLALEQSGSVCEATGWQARHLLVWDRDLLVAALPLYQKSHSWGEYVFDQQWAGAYQYYGLDYYPKWLTAVPFTPCRGPRLLMQTGADSVAVAALLLNYIQAQDGISSWHCLFPEAELAERLQTAGMIVRTDVQFHWFNRGYRDFDDYLQGLSAAKRKMVKRERRRVAEQGVTMLRIPGAEVSDEQWRAFYRFYAATYRKHGNRPYLTPAFFRQIAQTMAESCLMVLAVKNGAYVAAALSFVGADSLYGRYWGCDAEYDALHFEACYYQGLEHCIAQGLSHFDSGAQGEHKVARGFEPVLTHSLHWIKDARFAEAIARSVEREQAQVLKYQQDAAAFLPFRQDNSA